MKMLNVAISDLEYDKFGIKRRHKTDFSDSLNRSVYAPQRSWGRRPLGGSGYGFARSIVPQQSWGTLIPTPKLRHILPALVAFPSERRLRKALMMPCALAHI
jgi:hypothetical protein